jgi:cardiolipin synthase
VKSSPSEGSSAAKLLYIVSIVAAKKSIYINSAYFVPDKDTTRALEGAVRRGVDVRVIVPGEFTDVPLVRSAGWFYYNALLRRGIRIFEYQPTMMHAKSMVVDGIWTTISSSADDRSFGSTTSERERLQPDIAAQMEQMFFEDLARSEEITRRRWLERPRPWFERLKERVAGWLKPQL